MHELSIVMSIIDIAEEQLKQACASSIDEIEIDIGELSTVEMNAFDFAWSQGVKQTILERTAKKINRIQGKATCADCNAVFPVEQLYDPCPICGRHFINVIEGKELRIKSLVVS